MYYQVLKSIVLVLVLNTISYSYIQAQNVGINSSGSAPAASAGLDVSFTDKGLLIPRVALTATNTAGPVSAPATSLLVYNTATAGTAPNNVTPGYYFWTGIAWTRLSNGTQGNWDLQGNAGTSPNNNFIGTTDAQDLVVKTNNAEALRVRSSGNVGIGTNAPAEKLDVNGNIKIGSATTGSVLATGELVMRQDGDTYGPSILRLRNRNAENGAIFETTSGTITLVDFIFKTAISQSNIRMEGRASDTYTGSAPEWQFGEAANPTFVTNHAGTYTFVRRGNFGVGISQPSAALHLKAGTATTNTAPLKFTSGVNLTTPENGAVEFDGANYYVTAGSTRYIMAKLLTTTATVNFGTVASLGSLSQTVTVNGAAVNDPVVLGMPANPNAGLFFSAFVSAANTVTIRAYNNTLLGINPGTMTFRVSVLDY